MKFGQLSFDMLTLMLKSDILPALSDRNQAKVYTKAGELMHQLEEVRGVTLEATLRNSQRALMDLSGRVPKEEEDRQMPTDQPLEGITQGSYVAAHGRQCPVLCCGGRPEGTQDEISDNGRMLVGMFCTKCGARWNETYKLTGYSDLELTEVKDG